MLFAAINELAEVQRINILKMVIIVIETIRNSNLPELTE